MLFHYLKYIRPIWFFNLPTSFKGYFIDYDQLSDNEKSLLLIDENYQTEKAKKYDLAYQSLIKGIVRSDGYLENIDSTDISIIDNYRFLRRYFHSIWVFYVFLIRIFSFHNPIKEISAFLKTKQIKRLDVFANVCKHEEYQNFESKLIQQNPKVSIIIPTLNRYDYLKDVLVDLENQDYKNFEVVVADQSDNFDASFYDNYNLDFNIIHLKQRGLWNARNMAIKAAKGELIALSEDDVRIESNWLSQHLKAIDYFNVEISAGVFFPEGHTIPKERNFFSWAFQFATGNAVLYKSVYQKVGLFDMQFEGQRMGDGEFGLRCYLAGIKSISNPYASCIDVKAPSGGLRQMGSWDAFRPTSFFAPRPVPSVLYLFRKYYGNQFAKLALLKSIPPSIIPYQFKRNRKMLLLGAFVSIFLIPIILYQVFLSWSKATEKLDEGAKIEKI